MNIDILSLNVSNIASSEPHRLNEVHNELISTRMMMDLAFSDFLSENEWKMGEDVHTPIWETYRAMNKQYTKVLQLITQTEYYIRKYA